MVTALHLDIAQMSVPSLKTVAVVDLYSIAITGATASEHHSSGRSCDHRRALERGHVEAAMERCAPGEGIDALAEARGLAIIDGDRRGERGRARDAAQAPGLRDPSRHLGHPLGERRVEAAVAQIGDKILGNEGAANRLI